jgi:tetratricopeptide (TPR) repeat protein
MRLALPFLVSLLAPVVWAGEEWHLDFERHQRPWTAEGDAPATVERFRLGIGAGYFRVEEAGRVRVWDLAAMRHLRLVDGAPVEEYPLIALLDERERELRRDLEPITLLARSGAPAALTERNLFFLESRTGLRAGLGAFAGRLATPGPPQQVWNVGGALVAAWSTDGETVPAGRLDDVRRAARHLIPLHPELLQALLGGGVVPRQIRFQERLGARERLTEWRLLAVGFGSDDFLTALRALPPPPPTAHGLDQAIAVATGRVAGTLQPLTPEALGAQFKEQLDHGLAAEALLTLLELYLQTGADTTEAMVRLEPQAGTDATLGHLLAGLAVGTPAEGAESLRRLAQVDRDTLLRRHIYDLCLANALLAAGRFRDAEPLYLGALARNPWLVGAYKKLGDLYAASDRPARAWTAYAAGLALLDSHPMFKPVRAEGARLRQAYPDFFLPPIQERRRRGGAPPPTP